MHITSIQSAFAVSSNSNEAPQLSQRKTPSQSRQDDVTRKTYDRQFVASLFDSIAFRYDFLNHFLSSGFDILWRRKAAVILSRLHPRDILDVATGTGDLAFALTQIYPKRIIGVDIAPKMLELAKRKSASRKLEHVVTFEEGYAEKLRFSSESFDAVSVAFGVRNFSNLTAGLSEMHRVLRSGGMALVLEFSKPRIFPLRQLYGFYFKHVLPRIGGVISGNKEAYRYLPATVAEFPDGEAFLQLLHSAGFERLHSYPLTFGIATIYVGFKP